MTNAKDELLDMLEQEPNPYKRDPLKIKCAYLTFLERTIILKQNYSQQDYERFLDILDYKYDTGYGKQEMKGYIWLEDGTWLERGEYDGSEWWEHKVLPEIPEECF